MKVNPGKVHGINRRLLNDPTLTDAELAEEFHLAESTVAKLRTDLGHDHNPALHPWPADIHRDMLHQRNDLLMIVERLETLRADFAKVAARYPSRKMESERGQVVTAMTSSINQLLHAMVPAAVCWDCKGKGVSPRKSVGSDEPVLQSCSPCRGSGWLPAYGGRTPGIVFRSLTSMEFKAPSEIPPETPPQRRGVRG